MFTDESLPALLDRKAVAHELGVPRSTVDAIFRALPVVTFPDHRKVYVRREDVTQLLDAGTHRPGERVR